MYQACRITIGIAEDHRLVREALKEVLRQEPVFEVTSEANDGLEAIGMVEKTNQTSFFWT